MALLTLKINLLEKHRSISSFLRFFVFVNFLSCLINEWSHTTLLAFKEGATEHILRVRKRFYGFDSVFSKVSFEFCLLFFFL